MAGLKTKGIHGKDIQVVPWGFLTMMPIKRKLMAIFSGVSPELVEVASGFESGSEFGEAELGSVITLISTIVEKLDDDTLMWFIKAVLSNVQIDGVEMNTDGNIDKALTEDMILFYKITIFVMEVNFGDFFAKLKTLLDSSALTDSEEPR